MSILRAKALSICLLAALLPVAAGAQSNYAIRPGDTLRLEVLEDESLNRNLLVLPDGRIAVPMAGSIQAAGRSLSEVQRNIASALSGSFALQPTVYVDVMSLAERTPAAPKEPEPPVLVYVLGEAANPGRVEIEPGTTVLQLFAQVGGFTSFAAEKRIQLRRTEPKTGQETIYQLNYKAIQSGRSPNGLVQLQSGDVIMIPQRRLFE
jgi:polysaccharide export outer membrane protein